MKKLIAGNWKMNGSAKIASDLIGAIAAGSAGVEQDLLVCVPYPYLSATEILSSGKDNISFGAQDCSAHAEGAYTGEVSASMLSDMGCSHVIVGHSERREYHNEASDLVSAKAALAQKNGLVAIICVGETLEQREAGSAEEVVEAQLKGSIPSGSTAGNTVIAYEPVWAIGTGKVASEADVEAMHGFIREKLKTLVDNAEEVRILYGGSMKPDNAAALLSTPNVDGGLIGGASLDAQSFLAIAKAV